MLNKSKENKKNRVSDVRIAHSDALPLSWRDSGVSQAKKENSPKLSEVNFVYFVEGDEN